LDTVKIWRTALSNRFHGVLPSTLGGGSGFIRASYHLTKGPSILGEPGAA
jgi:hypothetical protein